MKSGMYGIGRAESRFLKQQERRITVLGEEKPMSVIGDDVQSVRCPHTISRPGDKIKWAIIEAAPPQIEGQLDSIAFEH